MSGRHDRANRVRWLLFVAGGLLLVASSPRASPSALATPLVAGPLAPAPAQVAAPNAGPLTIRDVAQRIRPAVVQIVSQLGTGSLDRLRGTSVADTGIGSGVLIDSAGHILTNQHVVKGAQTLTVALADGRTFDGRLIGADADT